jgi:hypothetical protein
MPASVKSMLNRLKSKTHTFHALTRGDFTIGKIYGMTIIIAL